MSGSARASGTTVRKAVWADAPGIERTLGRAFFDDPVMMYIMPDAAARKRKVGRVFRILFKLGLPHGACFVTGNYESVTLWRPPNGWHMGLMDYLANGPQMLGVFGMRALKAMAMMDKIEKLHPRTPHWYLQAIGTDPASQGKGFGGVIMRDQLARADAVHMPCYLESSKDTNIPIYKTFGFEVMGEIKIPGGPTLWPMWRDPR